MEGVCPGSQGPESKGLGPDVGGCIAMFLDLDCLFYHAEGVSLRQIRPSCRNTCLILDCQQLPAWQLPAQPKALEEVGRGELHLPRDLCQVLPRLLRHRWPGATVGSSGTVFPLIQIKLRRMNDLDLKVSDVGVVGHGL